mgnify:CR=1 FL=1
MQKLTSTFVVALICVIFLNLCFAQSVAPEVHAASGEHFANANAMLSWTIGENLIETFSGTNAILTQGFQQSLYTITSIEEAADNNYQWSVYPNPVPGIIIIQSAAGNDISVTFSAEIIDLQGKILFHQNFEGTVFQIDISQFANSTYFLKIADTNGKSLKTFKIQKINQR